MIYRVKATFNYEKAREFYQNLTDGTIARQRPDGQEIVNSMNRAVIDDHGDIHWTETCFCPTSLQHERATVYDHYFTNLKTKLVSVHEDLKGQSFINKIASV